MSVLACHRSEAQDQPRPLWVERAPERKWAQQQEDITVLRKPQTIDTRPRSEVLLSHEGGWCGAPLPLAEDYPRKLQAKCTRARALQKCKTTGHVVTHSLLLRRPQSCLAVHAVWMSVPETLEV
eukprot:1804323-Rhodomonas_salina.2